MDGANADIDTMIKPMPQTERKFYYQSEIA